MENCENILDLLNAYIDGELDESEAERVRAHIELCENCKKTYEELVKLNQMFSDSVETAPDGLVDSVLEKIKGEKCGKVINFRKISAVAAAAVVALAVVGSPLISEIVGGGAAKEECADNVMELAPSVDVSEYYYSDSKFDGGILSDHIVDPSEKADAPAEEAEMPEASDVENLEVIQGVEYKAVALNGEGFTVKFNGEIAIFDGEKYKYTQSENRYVLTSGEDILYLKAHFEDGYIWFEQTENLND